MERFYNFMSSPRKKQNDVPHLRFPEFSNKWSKSRLNDVSSITTGSTPPTGDRRNYGGDIPFVSPSDLSVNRFVTYTQNTVTQKGFETGRKIERGSVLFVGIGSTIGKVAQAGKMSISNQQIHSLASKISHSNDFLYYRILKDSKKIKLQAGTQAVPQLNKSSFARWETWFPEFTEQQKIAEFLGSIDARLDNLRQQKTAFENYKRGMMQKIFTQKIRFKDETGKNYAEWEEVFLYNLATAVKGKGLSKDDITEDGTNECVRYAELYTDYTEVINYIQSKTNISAVGMVVSQPNDLLFPSSGETAEDIATFSCIRKAGVILSGDLNAIRFNKEADSVFFAYYLSNYHNNTIARYAQGNSVVHLYWSHFRKIKIRIPIFAEQQKIATFLTSIDEIITAKAEEITKVEQWKKGLMQKMFV